MKTVLVTGASRGIGRAIALAFGARRANVVINYAQSGDAAEDVAARVRALGGQALTARADVRDYDAVRAMTELAKTTFGGVEVLVNNAGILRDKPISFMTETEWKDVIDVDLQGPFHCIKAVSRDMMRRKCGRIVNISSDAGLLGDVQRANYASAKAGLLGLTRTAAREFAGSGITVNAVAPGIIDTDMIAGMPEPRRARMLERIPLGRFGTAEQVAEVVVFLASDDAAYITGQVLCVDGGLRM